MSYDNLPGLVVDVADGVATATFDHPPLNLMDGVLLPSVRAFVDRVRHDTDVRVVVFQSADPEFFIAHGDMHYLTDADALPAATQAALAAAPDRPVPDDINILQALAQEVRELPQVTIGKLAGFARGAGSEFFMSLDMRFAAIDRAGLAQPEPLLGIIPGGGGTVTMTSLVGRARALEVILGGDLVGAELAERYGLVNRALPAGYLDAYVDTLARRIAGLRPQVVAAVKTTVDAVAPPLTHEMYRVENAALYASFGDDVVDLAHRLLAAGIQTREGERVSEQILNDVQLAR